MLDHHIERTERTDWGYDLVRVAQDITGWDFTLYLGRWEFIVSYTQPVTSAVPIK